MPTLVVGMPEAVETVVLILLASMATTSVAMAPGPAAGQFVTCAPVWDRIQPDAHRGRIGEKLSAIP